MPPAFSLRSTSFGDFGHHARCEQGCAHTHTTLSGSLVTQHQCHAQQFQDTPTLSHVTSSCAQHCHVQPMSTMPAHRPIHTLSFSLSLSLFAPMGPLHGSSTLSFLFPDFHVFIFSTYSKLIGRSLHMGFSGPLIFPSCACVFFLQHGGLRPLVLPSWYFDVAPKSLEVGSPDAKA